MNIKQQAFELFKQGFSYGNISRKLGIGKTTVYDYVKELKLGSVNHPTKPVRNSSEQGANERSEQLKKEKMVSELITLETPIIEEKITPVIVKSPMKEFTGDDLIKMKFDSLAFTGKFLELIGKPSKLFSGIIWGLPKGGKSNFSLRFADYLQEYFGEVVYVAAEEGESVTLQEKFIEIGGSSVTVAESRNREEIREYLQSKSFDFVFIDSINNAGIDSDYLEIIKHENPKKSFISIVQATKGGNFKGDQALTHNCDFIIKVVAGIASHTGRFNTATEISIFNEPLYKKNPNPRKKAAEKVKIKVKGIEAESEEQNDISDLIVKPIKDLTDGIDWDIVFSSQIQDLDKKKEVLNTKPEFKLPMPTFKLTQQSINTEIKKSILPVAQNKKSNIDLSGLNLDNKKATKAVLKTTAWIIGGALIYDFFSAQNAKAKKQEEEAKKK